MKPDDVHTMLAPTSRSTSPWQFLAALTVLCGICPTAEADPVDCVKCHSSQAAEWKASVHRSLACQECHGGSTRDDLPAGIDPSEVKEFDHGTGFVGRVARSKIPQLCGECHSDVARMNPFGLRTDQLAAYWTSGHGKTLKERADARVAVCSDCHGIHDVMKPTEPTSRTNPLNVPATCGRCHAEQGLMKEFDLAPEIVAEYRRSVHGEMLLDHHDSGAPTCATCHGNHAATPPGFASVGAVCGQCHQHASQNFAKSIHAQQESFHGCVQCHGGGPDAHFHAIERITKPAGLLIQRYAHLMHTEPPTARETISRQLNPTPREILTRVLPSCFECHESLESDPSLQKLFDLITVIGRAEQNYVETAAELDRVGRGVLLVENQRFLFEEATTHLIALAPLQHTLDNEVVEEKVADLNKVCAEVRSQLGELERGLRYRRMALGPIWLFALMFSALLYLKYKRLKAQYVAKPPVETP